MREMSLGPKRAKPVLCLCRCKPLRAAAENGEEFFFRKGMEWSRGILLFRL